VLFRSPVGIVVGIVSDKMASRKWPLGVLMLASAVTYALMPSFSTELYLILIVLFGIAVMGIVGLCFSAVAELVEPQYGGVAVGMLNTFQWVGLFLSGSLVGLLIQEFGWTTTFYILVPITVIGAICTFITPKLR
jgi:sugar phosphate permease